VSRLQVNPKLERVVIVCFDRGTEAAYQKSLRELQGAGNEDKR